MQTTQSTVLLLCSTRAGFKTARFTVRIDWRIKIEPTDGRSRSIALRDQRASRLSDALAKAVMFYYHLERQVVVPRNDTPFELQAFELIDSAIYQFLPNEETRIYHSNAHFGLYLKNRTSYSYYIYIFYFDPNDFSITPIYLPPTDMPSVPKEGELTIGYGNNGAPPLTFTVAPGLTTDPGFFKIFYSTSPSEVGTIKQKGVDPNQRYPSPRNTLLPADLALVWFGVISNCYRQQPPSPKVGVYGLIIGINIYKRPQIHPDLMGCVGDANSVLKYFTEDLNVPEENFLCLYDEKATREGILQGFVTHLIRNPAIRYHTPIVIYYAGHGDRMPAPSGWQAADNMVEMILPHDAGTMDANGQYVYGIPDLTLAFLLYSLSQAKGNNITVILDSCNSGSGTRSIEVRSRNSHDRYSPDIPNNLDAKLRRSLGVDYPTEIEHNLASKQPAGTLLAPSLDTHILLAACQEEELAQEIPNVDPETHELGNPPSKGVFTSTLLHELRKADLGYTSYTTLFRNMLSTHREFRPKLPSHLDDRRSSAKGKISLMPTSDKAVYRARDGLQGSSPRDAGREKCRTNHVGTISIEPNNPQDIPGGAYATIIKYNDHSNGVRIWVDEGVRADEFWQRIITNLQPLPIFWADSKSPGHQDMEIVMFGEDIHVKNSDAPLREKLGVTLRELKEKNNNWGSIIYESVGNDLFGESVSNGTVTIIHPDPDKIYGLELVNNSTENLYPYILYYDFEDYSVTCLYEPAGRTVKPPLPAVKR
ncbi:Caspase domain [Rhizoctonia solani]|uniref:Caspase domain n=1 Tax=Rhizoctonia solani TaxID=456999 RepID=A0A8H7LZG3_9AGAM|nr:Caspase domain [Rhizoctonia solani]